MLRGRCACKAVGYEVEDQFVVAYNCHCSNCRAMTGSAFLPWGEIEPDKLRVINGMDSLLVSGNADAASQFRQWIGVRRVDETRAASGFQPVLISRSQVFLSFRPTERQRGKQRNRREAICPEPQSRQNRSAAIPHPQPFQLHPI